VVNPRQHVLIIEDEPDVVDLLVRKFGKAEFLTAAATDGYEGLAAAQKQKPALIILDLMLPKMSGLEVCRALKSDGATRHIPIMMLTAKAEEVDCIIGLELGADDYVSKPFSPREVVLRVQGILRRGDTSAEAQSLVAGPITIDAVRHQVLVNGKPVHLTSIEFKLLRTLVQRRGRVQQRDRLLSDVWGYESVIETRTVDTHVRRLREKLRKAGDAIETVRGFGYRVRER
jgi:DNA-binding response OmpR family regulator